MFFKVFWPFLIFVLFAGNKTIEAAEVVNQEITSKIIGGTTSDSKAWPWMTGLVRKGFGVWESLYCGASLIHKDWVLTAAHCVDETQASDIQAIIGRFNLLESDGELINISQIILHPDYDPDFLLNDIALLHLQQSSSIKPIQTLDHFSVQDDQGELALALGWGAVSATESLFPDVLQEVEIPIVSLEICKELGSNILDSMICGGYAFDGKDTCNGDSGGPLIVFDEESQQWRQAGITSFGFGSCGGYGTYTRLEQYKTFISDSICSTDQKPVTPVLSLDVDNITVTASWTTDPGSAGYRLNFAPYPSMSPVYSADMNQANQFSVQLNSHDAYYVAISAYNGNCRSNFSNIESFVLP